MSSPGCNLLKKFILLYSGTIASSDDRVNCHRIETHHSILPEIRLDLHIRNPHVLFIGIATKHIDSLTDDVAYIIDLTECSASLRKIHTDYNISPHLTCQSSRIIISQTTIHKHHSVNSHRSKHTWNRHGRTHGIIYLAAMPDLRLT